MSTPLRVITGAFALLLVLIGSAALYWYWVPLHRGFYVSADRALEARIGFPAGTTLATETALSCVASSGAMIDITPERTLGYEVEDVYDLQRPMTVRELLAFFRRRLTGWTKVGAVHYTGPLPPWLNLIGQQYQQGNATFSFRPLVGADGSVTGIRTFANADDHGYDCA